MRYGVLLLLVPALSAFLSNHATRCIADEAVPASALVRCEIVFERSEFCLGENPVAAIVITNTNAFTVWAPSPEVCVAVYAIDLRFPNASESATLRETAHQEDIHPPFTAVPPGGTFRLEFLLFPDFHAGRLTFPPGDYAVTPHPLLRPYLSNPDDGAADRADWTCSTTGITFREPDAREQAALELLWDGWRAIDGQSRQHGDSTRARRQFIELYEDFLGKHGDSLFADEVRYEMVKELLISLGNKHEDEAWRKAQWPSLEESASALLRRGGAYANPLLKWDQARGGNALLNLAARNGSEELLRMMVDGINQRDPQDLEEAAYRGIIVAAVTGSLDEARRRAQSYAERFPDGVYGPVIEPTIRSFERMRSQR